MKLGIKLALLSTMLVGAVVATTSWVFTHSLRSSGEREVDAELASDALLVTHAVQTGHLPEDMLAELARPGLSWLVVREGRISRGRPPRGGPWRADHRRSAPSRAAGGGGTGQSLLPVAID